MRGFTRIAGLLLALMLGLSGLSLSGDAYAEGDPEAGKIKAQTCSGCHGITGYKNIYPMFRVPKIAGQNAVYLNAALNAYRSGDRQHTTMVLQAQSLSETDQADIVAFLSKLSLTEEQSTIAPSAPENDQLPLCQSCHGKDGRSTDAVNPILAGQYADYIEHALNDYRSGARKNAIMGGFAGQLSDQDIEQLAAWFAALSALEDISH